MDIKKSSQASKLAEYRQEVADEEDLGKKTKAIVLVLALILLACIAVLFTW
ncbi:MAG: hypothetical protein HY064_00080 [Bacteroidetes bacterium]|nr:hypothetical protein [Bacteroidota bacterium]